MCSFYARSSQKRKKDSQLKQHFALLGSASVKAAHKHIDEIDPYNATEWERGDFLGFENSLEFFQTFFSLFLQTFFMVPPASLFISP